MSHYGCTLTKKGSELLAKIMAEKMPLVITGIKIGSGICPDDIFPGDLEGLIDPVADGTSNVPWYSGDTVRMTIEFRSDMNGGLKKDVLINEFGVFAKDLDGSKVMLYYGTLGDSPQKVCAFNGSGIDIRRFPISIKVGEQAQVIIDYSPEGLMTAEDVAEYCTTTLLPQIIEEVLKALGGGSGGFIEMEEPSQEEYRFDNTLYGLILRDYS